MGFERSINDIVYFNVMSFDENSFYLPRHNFYAGRYRSAFGVLNVEIHQVDTI